MYSVKGEISMISERESSVYGHLIVGTVFTFRWRRVVSVPLLLSVGVTFDGHHIPFPQRRRLSPSGEPWTSMHPFLCHGIVTSPPPSDLREGLPTHRHYCLGPPCFPSSEVLTSFFVPGPSPSCAYLPSSSSPLVSAGVSPSPRPPSTAPTRLDGIVAHTLHCTRPRMDGIAVLTLGTPRPQTRARQQGSTNHGRDGCWSQRLVPGVARVRADRVGRSSSALVLSSFPYISRVLRTAAGSSQ
ncbi:hypothetical protein EDB85DRAFT_228862 [Lactarius pseudohatsudake]|nr:hypothetical protein EDB85DRAFT_228862 [Lactarius pseudohatsudake]